jgi:hypothetical protein
MRLQAASASIGEHTVVRHDKRVASVVATGSDAFGDRHGLPVEMQSLGIKVLRQKRVVAQEQQESWRRVHRSTNRVEHERALVRVERLYGDTGLVAARQK